MSSKPLSAPLQQRRAAAVSDNSDRRPVAAVDEATRSAANHRLNSLTKPQGALGRLEPLAAQPVDAQYAVQVVAERQDRGAHGLSLTLAYLQSVDQHAGPCTAPEPRSRR